MFWDHPSKKLNTVTWQGAQGEAGGESGQVQSDGTKHTVIQGNVSSQAFCETIGAIFILAFLGPLSISLNTKNETSDLVFNLSSHFKPALKLA